MEEDIRFHRRAGEQEPHMHLRGAQECLDNCAPLASQMAKIGNLEAQQKRHDEDNIRMDRRIDNIEARIDNLTNKLSEILRGQNRMFAGIIAALILLILSILINFDQPLTRLAGGR